MLKADAKGKPRVQMLDAESKVINPICCQREILNALLSILRVTPQRWPKMTVFAG